LLSDLPAERSQLQRPVVYHMIGKLSASPTYVVSDEDRLEFICALQSEHLTPEKLFHELEHSHLLLVGSDFSNWLARLFLRMAKRKRLSDPRDFVEILADDHTSEDERLLAFLQQVSVRTRVFSGAKSFAAELHQRWLSWQQPASATSPMGLAPRMRTIQPDIATETAIDPENPWLGLAGYSEETRACFHGRDEEAAELARRAQRELLTVLFGQSGLGRPRCCARAWCRACAGQASVPSTSATTTRRNRPRRPTSSAASRKAKPTPTISILRAPTTAA
jgi:SIR2-like domain